MGKIKSGSSAKPRLNKFALSLALAALASAGAVAWAQDQPPYSVTVDGGLATILTPGASDSVNDLGNVADPKNIVINIKVDQTANPAGAQVNAFWRIHGTAGVVNPGTDPRFKNFTIKGDGDDPIKLFSGGPGPSPLMEILNVGGNLTISNLNFEGGQLKDDDTRTFTTGGAGLFAGATDKYNAPYTSPFANLVLQDVSFKGNLTEITNSAAGRAASGALFVDASDYGRYGADADGVYHNGNVGLVNLTLENNYSTAAGNVASPTAASATGGGARIKNAKVFIFQTGDGEGDLSLVKGNRVLVEYGSQAQGGGLALESGAQKTAALIDNVTFSDNQAIARGAGSGGGDTFARGGALHLLHDRDTDTAAYDAGRAADLWMIAAVTGTTTFTGNKAVAETGTRAMGGAVNIAGMVQAGFKSEGLASGEYMFEGNIADATTGGLDASGGAISQIKTDVRNGSGPNDYEKAGGSLTLIEVGFKDNVAKAAGAAMGGALYTQLGLNDASTGNKFIDNQAVGVTSATGGAIHTKAAMRIAGSSFSGNKAQAESAFGGALYLVGDPAGKDSTGAAARSATDVTGTGFSDNRAVGSGHGLAQGGAIYQEAGTLNITGRSSLTGNRASAANNEGQGGAVYQKAGNVSVQNATMSANQATSSQNAAKGGAVYTENGTLTLSTRASFYQNEAVARMSDAFGGAVYHQSGNFIAQGGSPFSDNNVSFSQNKAQAGGEHDAAGGGVYLQTAGSAALSNINFSQNAAKTAALNNGHFARGGAVYATNNLNVGGGAEFAENVAQANEAGGQASAEGGAVYYQAAHKAFNVGDASAAASTFRDNAARTARGLARGGAIAVADKSSLTVANTSFQGNTAAAAEAGGQAFGGAVAMMAGAFRANGAGFDGNSAVADAAYGGALYLAQGSHTISDTSFTNNSVSGLKAEGGGIFLDTSLAASSLTIDASSHPDNVVAIMGNTAGGASSGIHIGRTALGASADAANLKFNAAAGAALKMMDALIVDMDGEAFNFEKTGAGGLEWYGRSQVTANGNAATLRFNEGVTTFGSRRVDGINDDFVLTAGADTEMHLEFGAGTVTRIDATRTADRALFDFTAADAGSITVHDGAVLDILDTRQALLDRHISLKLVENSLDTSIDLSSLENFTLGETLYNYEFVALGDDLWFNADYISPYGKIIAKSGRNTQNAIYALDALLNTYDPGSPELDLITASLKAVTPEYALASGVMAVNVTEFIHRRAVEQGLRQPQRDTIRPPLFAQAAGGQINQGPRVWGGYAGNFRKADTTGGYFGYDQDTSGAILGVTYDFGPKGSVGAFAAYTSNKVDFNSVKSSNESDGFHFGVIGRWSPLDRVDPNFSIYADAGYALFQNEGERRLGGRKTKGSFDQNLYTLGLGLEYVAAVTNDIMLTPALEVRYIHLKQDGFRENGLTSTDLQGFEADSLSTNLSLTASTDITISDGTITPALKVGWRHEYLDRNYHSRARYHLAGVGYIGDSFAMGTVPVDEDSYDIGLGVRTMLDSGNGSQVGLNISYDLNLSKNSDTQSVYGGLEYRF